MSGDKVPKEIDVTAAMVVAGEARYHELVGEFATAYLVEQVFLAMARVCGQGQLAEHNCSPKTLDGHIAR
jgi:hypothetical protein